MKNSIIIFVLFIAGLLLGLFDFIPNIKDLEASKYALYALLLFIGIGIGADKNSINIIRKIDFKIILVPLSVVLGSIIGTALISLFIKSINVFEAMAVGSGFGYYSLSSVMINEMHSEYLGVIALLSNLIRELITLILAPFMVKYFGKLAPIAAGGATSMDITLPIITKYSGKDYVIISIFSGIILSILVPILVGFFISL